VGITVATKIKTDRRARGHEPSKVPVRLLTKGSRAASAHRAFGALAPARATRIRSEGGGHPRGTYPSYEITIFISYPHVSPHVGIAQQLYQALRPPADTWGAEVFMDQHALEPADLVDQRLIDAIDRTTHFIALLSNSYWSSTYCRKEIARAVERFERGERVSPLFVKAEEFNLRYFSFDSDRREGRIRSTDPLIASVGDLRFLGPYDGAERLRRLRWEEPSTLSDQIAQLVDELESVIHR
jgi:hypothetical protein